MKIKPVSKGGVVMELGAFEARIPSVPALPVFHLKKILVPIDFSESYRKGLQYGICFAEQFQAELTLLHIVQTYPVVADGAPVEFESVQNAWEDLEVVRRSIPDSVKSQVVVRQGNAGVEIIAAAEELGADLIILFTHGRFGLERLLFGSTTRKVVRRAGCPVLVVRETEHEFIASSQTAGA